MNNDTLIKYLLASNNLPDIISDIYFNNIELLLRLDASTNSLGLPFYRDYSTKQRQVREFQGTSNQSDILFVNSSDSTYPNIKALNNINVDSFLYIPNKYNHTLRIAELNSGTMISTIKGTYLEVMLNGLNSPHNFGTQDFTIELSFYADQLNLPWRFQTLFTIGETFFIDPAVTLSTIGTTYGSFRTPFGLYLQSNSLVFFDTSASHVIATSLQNLTWYHVVIQRKGNTFEFYLNFNKVKTDSISNFNYTFTTATNADTSKKTLTIGASNNNITTAPFVGYVYTVNSHVDWTFSGGISNFRITNGIARYAQSFYSPTLPFYIADLDDRLDGNYNDVLYFTPFNYDLYDYSKYKAHFTNNLLISKLPANYTTGFLEINGANTYNSKLITTNLNATAWTIEFYYTFFINSQPVLTTTDPSHIIGSIAGHYGVNTLLQAYQVAGSGTKLDKRYGLVSITSNGNKVLELDLRWLWEEYLGGISQNNYISKGFYFALKASTDGTNWIAFQSNPGVWVTAPSGYNANTSIPVDDLMIYRQSDASNSSGNTGNIVNSTVVFKGAYSEPQTHVAIQRYNNFIYFFINGVMVNSVPFTYSLYSSINNTVISLDTYTNTAIEGTNSGTNYILSQGIKGLRITNDARYNISNTNEFFASHSQYPVALTSGALVPPRARILNIINDVTLPSVSSEFVTWSVYLTQQVDNIALEDFSLTQLEGVQDASLVSIVKVSEYLYTLKANTGTGNGQLGLNFVDRKTITYKGTSTYISTIAGELSYQGSFYVINKESPIPTLTSGSSPYVTSDFEVDITFNGAIATFNPNNIGIVNGTLTSSGTINADLQQYKITVTPLLEDAVTIQAMEGTGVTDTGLFSGKSNALVRIYSDSFPILQTPLNISTTRNDLSPSELVLNEVITNNTVFSNVIAPFGETSSLYVSPTLEQSGLVLLNYNAVASTSTNGANQDWTIEFFLRVNSLSTITHVFSIENASTGICFIASNKNLLIQRTITNTASLFTGLNIADIDTTTFTAWTDTTETVQQKYPHFAITKQGSTYRFYRNGVRIQLIQSSVLIDVSQGDLHLGYYTGYVNHADCYISNLRVTLGKALYTSATVNIPGLPYSTLPNIADETQLISYISIYSNNYTSTRATLNDNITLKFVSILPLENVPTVTICGKLATVTSSAFNTYYALLQVDNTIADGNATFLIQVTDQPGIPDKSFSNTTNNSTVVVDKAALTVAITTNEPNNNNYLFDIFFTFSSDTLVPLTLDLITTTNCICSNLFKYANQNIYKVTVTGLTDGDITVQLDSNKIKDLAGNYNIASATFTRTVVVPAYIPDVYWSNVIFLLQPEINIIDESNNGISITNNNVVLTSENSPIGLSKSLKFNGTNSSLSFTLGQTLSSTIDWTIEFYVYIKNSTVIKLNSPTILPSSSIAADSFLANWGSVTDADSYRLDVAKDSSFNTYVPGFKQRDIGINTSFLVSSTVDDAIPVFSNQTYIGNNGIITKYSYDNNNNMGYYIDVSLTDTFSNKLYKYNNLFTDKSYIAIGSSYDLTEEDIVQVLDDVLVSGDSSTSNGNIITGILSQDNYPKVLYVLEESSVRLYPDNDYVLPGIVEDVEVATWNHIALVNKNNCCTLYRNGEAQDKVKNISWTDSLVSIGYNIGFINALMSGIRITKGIARYISSFIPPNLPFGKG